MAKISEKKNTLRNQIKLIRKSNKLVEARYKFDIWEMRVFVKMVSLIKPEDKDFTQYKISVSDIINDFGLPNSGNYYSLLRQGAENLLTKQVEMERMDEEGKKKKIKANLISSTESYINDDEGKDVILKFDPELKKHLLDLKAQYLTYDIRNILKLTSVYSIRIYELLKQFEGLITSKGFAKRKFLIEELKLTLGIGSDEYSLYGHFKNKVLLKAQKDLLEETDIRFEIEEEKNGRKIVAVHFVIYKNRPKKRGEEQTAETPEENYPELNSIYEKVKEFVSREVVLKWFKELSVNQIVAGVSYSLDQHKEGKVQDMAKYLQKMVREKTLLTQVEVKFAKEEEEKQRIEEKARKKELEKKREEEEEQFKRDFLNRKREVMLEILNESPDEFKTVIGELKSEIDNGSDNMFTTMAWERYQKELGGKPESLDEFIRILDIQAAVYGYVSNKMVTLYPDRYTGLIVEYKKVAQEKGFSDKTIY